MSGQDDVYGLANLRSRIVDSSPEDHERSGWVARILSRTLPHVQQAVVLKQCTSWSILHFPSVMSLVKQATVWHMSSVWLLRTDGRA